MVSILLAIIFLCCPIYKKEEPEVKAKGESGLCKTEKHAIVEAKYAASSNLRDACAAKGKALDTETVDYSQAVCTWYHSGDDKSVSCEIKAGADCKVKLK